MPERVLPTDDEIDGLVLGPDSLAWRRAGDARLLIGAGYALLLQVAHPTVGAGVAEHSDFERDPWGRLLRTLDYVNLSVYGGRDAAEVGRRVREMHKRIKGVAPGGRRYHALEPEPYAWVHATLLEAIVSGHERFGRPLRPHEVERFYREWRGLGRLLGVRERDLPPDWTGFRAYFSEMVAERLERTETVDAVLRTLSRPAPPPVRQISEPLWRLLRITPARATRIATIGLLPPLLRARFGLRWTAANELEFRALGRASRALTPVLPRSLRVMGPGWLRLRADEIAAGDFGPHSAEPRAA